MGRYSKPLKILGSRSARAAALPPIADLSTHADGISWLGKMVRDMEHVGASAAHSIPTGRMTAVLPTTVLRPTQVMPRAAIRSSAPAKSTARAVAASGQKSAGKTMQAARKNGRIANNIMRSRGKQVAMVGGAAVLASSIRHTTSRSSGGRGQLTPRSIGGYA